jgi:hypothetical protein
MTAKALRIDVRNYKATEEVFSDTFPGPCQRPLCECQRRPGPNPQENDELMRCRRTGKENEVVVIRHEEGAE